MEDSGIRYLTLPLVIGIHADIMRLTGFAPAPIRDEGTLESAVMRPQMAAHYAEADLMRQAALLGAGVAQAQAFLDGNKRTAFAAMDVFLRLNGFEFIGELQETLDQFAALASRSDSLDAATDRFEAFLREHVRPLP